MNNYSGLSILPLIYSNKENFIKTGLLLTATLGSARESCLIGTFLGQKYMIFCEMASSRAKR